jgi:hypothetical protein
MYNDDILAMPRGTNADLEERESKKKRLYLLLAKRSLSTIFLTTYLRCLVIKGKTKKELIIHHVLLSYLDYMAELR